MENTVLVQEKLFRKRYLLAGAIIFIVLLIDQWLKIKVKTTMILNSEFPVFGDWFYIHFTENPGMAFGMEFGGEYGKLVLTLFRMVAVGGLLYYLISQIRQGAGVAFVFCLSLITAGAAGNIIDSLFYGQWFTDSYFRVAQIFPETGYASYFHGKVVDMLYFPLIEGFFPDWLPIWGGEHYMFFRPIFNIADAAISCGVIAALIFQKSVFAALKTSPSPSNNFKESSHSSPDQETTT